MSLGTWNVSNVDSKIGNFSNIRVCEHYSSSCIGNYTKGNEGSYGDISLCKFNIGQQFAYISMVYDHSSAHVNQMCEHQTSATGIPPFDP